MPEKRGAIPRPTVGRRLQRAGGPPSANCGGALKRLVALVEKKRASLGRVVNCPRNAGARDPEPVRVAISGPALCGANHPPGMRACAKANRGESVKRARVAQMTLWREREPLVERARMWPHAG